MKKITLPLFILGLLISSPSFAQENVPATDSSLPSNVEKQSTHDKQPPSDSQKEPLRTSLDSSDKNYQNSDEYKEARRRIRHFGGF